MAPLGGAPYAPKTNRRQQYNFPYFEIGAPPYFEIGGKNISQNRAKKYFSEYGEKIFLRIGAKNAIILLAHFILLAPF